MNAIHTNLYSRQISTYGMDIMLKIKNIKVIIIGLRGLGIEISKNIILSGINEIYIFDDNICKISDLSSNFYISENDINKKRRDNSCIEKLRDLNRETQINIFDNIEILKKNIKFFDIVVITEILPTQTIIEINDICRENKKKFIYSSSLGISGFIFNDFGEEHTIYNKKGREPYNFLIKNITKEKNAKVTINIENESKSLYEFTDYVIFNNIKGMTQLNNIEPQKINIIDKETFSIGDTSNYDDYISGGIVKEIFVPFKQKFQSFKESFYNPFTEDIIGKSINMKKGKKELYHVCLIAIHHFLDNHGHLPEINNKNHVIEILKIVKLLINIGNNKSFIKLIELIDEKYLENIIKFCKISISPVCSFLGGIVSQEIVKITGKYLPINQWLYFDFFEKLDKIEMNDKFNALNSRYDEQIAIFGQTFQQKLSNLNIFIIGAGALGCEFLKIFSLMGIGTNKNACITVTDNDKIEMSNLSRQFLFKKKDNGFDKSEIACKEIKLINNDINLKCKNLRVSYETEDVFNDNFWEEQDLIICAVDNNQARRYIDNQCTFYNKIFLESGTMGTSASSMIIYPHITSCYDDLPVVVEKEIPVCTLKNFPTQIEHCIEFSKVYFGEFFEKNIDYLNSCINNADIYFKKLDNLYTSKKEYLENLEEIEDLLLLLYKKNINSLVEYSLKKYYVFFNKNILDLIKNNPKNAVDENGQPFWRGNKIMPHAIDFNDNDELSCKFIFYLVLILNRILEINLSINEKDVLIDSENIYSKIKSLKQDKKELITDEILNERLNNKKSNIIKLIKECQFNDKRFVTEKFDKDNDELFHVDFVHYFSNLRARNYNIEECDKEKTRTIAGNIIPAIVSTTACIAGFVALQIYSVIISKEFNSMRNIAINLGVNWYSLGRPQKMTINNFNEKTNKISTFINIPLKFTVWDNININGPILVKDLITNMKEIYNFDIDFLISNNECILDLLDDEDNEDNINKTIDELFNQRFPNIYKNKKYLKIKILGTVNNNEVIIPRIKYIIK